MLGICAVGVLIIPVFSNVKFNKTMETNKTFTLTAEEVKMEEQILWAALLKFVELYHADKQTSTAKDWIEGIDYCHKRLKRIKQWQDERDNSK